MLRNVVSNHKLNLKCDKILYQKCVHFISSQLFSKVIEIFKKKSIITKNGFNQTLNKQIEERNEKMTKRIDSSKEQIILNLIGDNREVMEKGIQAEKDLRRFFIKKCKINHKLILN